MIKKLLFLMIAVFLITACSGFMNAYLVDDEEVIIEVPPADNGTFASFYEGNPGSGTLDDLLEDLVTDSSGNIYITGTGDNSGNARLFVAKLDSSGNLVTGFGSNGVFMFSTADATQGQGICLDGSGNVLVSGYGTTGGGSGIIIRLNASTGALDTSFNSTGYLLVQPVGNISTHLTDVAVQSSRNIVLVGKTEDGTTAHALLKIVSATGSNVQETITTPGTAGRTYNLYGVAVDSSDAIFAAGMSNDAGTNDLLLTKYTSAGVLDTSFDTDGIVTHDGAAGTVGKSEQANDLALDSSGNPVVVGYSYDAATAPQRTSILWKFKSSDGSLDTGFGTSGVSVFSSIAAGSMAYDIHIDSNEKILASGYTLDANANFYLSRFTSTGTLDTTFNTTGYITGTTAGKSYVLGLMAVSNDGKVYIGGYEFSAVPKQVAIWKYQ